MATLERTLDGSDSTVTPYGVVPAAVVTTDAEGVESLLATKSVASVCLDQAFPRRVDRLLSWVGRSRAVWVWREL